MPGMKLRRSAGNPNIMHFEAGSAFTDGDVLTLDGTRRASRHSGGEQDVLGRQIHAVSPLINHQLRTKWQNRRGTDRKLLCFGGSGQGLLGLLIALPHA